MRQLTIHTQPKQLTLREMYKLHLLNKGVEDADWVINVLDAFFAGRNRDKLDVFGKLEKYKLASIEYGQLNKFLKGLVENE
jgi:hypothetical protein